MTDKEKYMTTEEIDAPSEMKAMYLSGASIRAIVEAYGKNWFRYEIINTIDSIKVELTSEEIRTRKLNKTKFKLNKLVGKHNVLTNKELEHQERVRHFQTKKLVIELSIIKLQACIDKLNAV